MTCVVVVVDVPLQCRVQGTEVLPDWITSADV